MFGIMNGCGLDRDGRKKWTARYRGGSAAPERGHGEADRLALNGDGVLFSMLAEARSPPALFRCLPALSPSGLQTACRSPARTRPMCPLPLLLQCRRGLPVSMNIRRIKINLPSILRTFLRLRSARWP